ncbi:unnamed protein product [Effrenium voratum]|uniref:Uncharacterized protein n=1 Tax=Effrenium voratum TaxID=2562239 RepID=A0AA36JC72_9DINO|nr:unnamed protein product [Effrenium voratum]
MEPFMEVQADELSASGSTFFGADSEDELELRGKSSSSTRTSTPNEVAPMAKVVEAEAKDLSEAGSELSRALLEAQQALDAARHFVQSPSLARRRARCTSSGTRSPREAPMGRVGPWQGL